MTIDFAAPFTRAEAIAAGFTDEELAGPRFVRLLHGVYIGAGHVVTTRIRARAALRISPPGSWVSHHTAGLLWGGWMPDTEDTHVTVPGPGLRSVRRGVNAHRARADTSTSKRNGIVLSSPLEVFLDLAAWRIDLVDLVVAGDSLVRATALKPDGLVEATAEWSNRGARFARRAASFVRAGVDSAPESRLRMLLVLAGLPEPIVNRIERTDEGEWKRRFELCYPEWKLLIEYDGEHHNSRAQQLKDLHRREALEREGWRIIVIVKEDLSGNPAGVLDRVRGALLDRGCTGLRSNFSAEWRRHFRPTRSAA